MPRQGAGRRPGTFVAVFLALLQVHLLWVMVLHRHQALENPSQALTLHQAAFPSGPGADGGLLCAACQIVRHGAVRPALGLVTLTPVASTILGVIAPSSHVSSFRPGVIYGRAPPLV